MFTLEICQHSGFPEHGGRDLGFLPTTKEAEAMVMVIARNSFQCRSLQKQDGLTSFGLEIRHIIELYSHFIHAYFWVVEFLPYGMKIPFTLKSNSRKN